MGRVRAGRSDGQGEQAVRAWGPGSTQAHHREPHTRPVAHQGLELQPCPAGAPHPHPGEVQLAGLGSRCWRPSSQAAPLAGSDGGGGTAATCRRSWAADPFLGLRNQCCSLSPLWIRGAPVVTGFPFPSPNVPSLHRGALFRIFKLFQLKSRAAVTNCLSAPPLLWPQASWSHAFPLHESLPVLQSTPRPFHAAPQRWLPTDAFGFPG